MPAAKMSEMLQLPSLQVSEPQVVEEQGTAWSSSSTPTLRRKHFRMRRARNAEELNPEAASSSKEFLQLPSIEITPSSDEDTPSWSNCSRGASPGSFLIRKWLTVGLCLFPSIPFRGFLSPTMRSPNLASLRLVDFNSQNSSSSHLSSGILGVEVHKS
uniref:Uncharacterized protein n=1 Tax=Naja naja TaxID=35670 RepID=A0A8C6XPX3_NAJNA